MVDTNKGKKRLSKAGEDIKGAPLTRVALELFDVPEELTNAALVEAKEKQTPLGEVLIEKKILTGAQVAEMWSAHLGLDFVDSVDVEAIPDWLLSAIPISFAKQNRLLPIALTPDDRVLIVCANPLLIES